MATFPIKMAEKPRWFRLLPVFMTLAFVGLGLSVIAHVLSLFGLVLPVGEAVFALHAGIFVVWFPAVLLMTRITRGARQKDIWKVALLGCPAWVKYFLIALGGYVFFNFFRGFAMSGAKHNGLAEDVRMFSGHWMIFYAVAAAVLYSAMHMRDDQLDPRCLSGHEMSPTDSFCPTCGQPRFVQTT